jgi:hypothetical protein
MPNVTFQLATPKVTRFDVMLEVQSRSRPGDPDTTLPLDRSHLIQYLDPPECADETDQWEDYGEPAWDPVWFEVHLLMRRYFEQADADSDRT